MSTEFRATEEGGALSFHLAVRPRAHPLGAMLLAMCVTLVLAGCGSQASSPAQPNTGTGHASPSTPTTSAGPGTSQAVAKAVAATFVEFFAGTTPAEQKVTLVQDGQGFASVIRAQAGGAMSQGTTATVSEVTLASSSHADVTYTILLAGTPALQDQAGTAVKENGHWVVGAATFCQLLTLEQSAPPLCKKV